MIDVYKLSFVKRSEERKKVFLSLSKPKFPKEIDKDVKLGMNRVSRALNELAKQGLVECLNPEDKRGRIYKRTKGGEGLVKEL